MTYGHKMTEKALLDHLEILCGTNKRWFEHEAILLPSISISEGGGLLLRRRAIHHSSLEMLLARPTSYRLLSWHEFSLPTHLFSPSIAKENIINITTPWSIEDKREWKFSHSCVINQQIDNAIEHRCQTATVRRLWLIEIKTNSNNQSSDAKKLFITS